MTKNEYYQSIVKSLVNYETEIRADGAIDSKSVDDIMYYVKSIDPSLFHVGSLQVAVSMLGNIIIHPEYLYSEAEYKSLKKQISEKIRPVKQYLATLSNDAEKEKYVHDYVCRSVRYSDNGLVSHLLVGPLLYGEGVCDGISQSVQLLLKSCGVKSYMVTGSAYNRHHTNDGAHAWNVVCIDGRWYHLDVTFDLGVSSDFLKYDYYNLTTNQILADHVIDYAPIDCKRECVHVGDYYTQRKLCFSDYDTLKRYFRHVFTKRKEHVQLRMSASYSEALKNDVVFVWNSVAREMNLTMRSGMSVNEFQSVFAWDVQYF
ncbi:MAG: hypothetical protein IJ011_06405 [Clostridia bacterium]|nr:hypothetical protein [Clostridia bacterium]